MTHKMEEELKRFAVVGAGPVGCIVAAFLSRGGYEVTLCDVKPEFTKPAIEQGIRLEQAESLVQRVAHTCEHVDDLGRYKPQVVFLTVKAYALRLIASAVESFYHDGVYFVSWQNGIDTEKELANSLEKKSILRAVVNYGCSLKEPGVVSIPFHHPPHFIQELDPSSGFMARKIAEALSKSGLETERTDQIVSMVWRKSIMNACMNPVCAVTGMTMAEVMSDPIVFKTVESLVKEGVQVARANEIHLGWDFFPYCMNYMKNAGNHKPSMLADIETGRKTEIDFINGKIVEYGAQAGIDTPFNSTMRSLVKGLESKITTARG
ncbi:MAG: 2-dehydropantoate 2-reductase [Deltaproteobacteria bacterium]|nr:2-dehydropantoate 2-reductase [Deltaproteobacteria bacterium]